jgi:hypothetical protein
MCDPERQALIAEALRITHGSPVKAADALRVSRSTVQRALAASPELRATQAIAAGRQPALADALRFVPSGSHVLEIIVSDEDPGSAEQAIRDWLAPFCAAMTRVS